MTRLEALFASRGARIGIILLWLVLGGLGGSFAQRFQDVQKNEESSFLPGSSESVKELTLAKQFRSGERFAAITVIRRDRGLAVTGGVITSAGVVLAGTFTMLATLPLKTLTELGFTIAFGVLLDTLIVRSLLVPALVFDAGRRVWWPSVLARRDAGSEPDDVHERAQAAPGTVAVKEVSDPSLAH